MKRIAALVLVVAAAAAFALPLVSHAKGTMAQYMVISPHTPEQCVKALDDAQATGGLAKWNFGCMDGDHTGYLMVTASSADEALKNVPADERPTAKAIKMHKFTAAELKSFHEKMAGK